MSFTDPPHSPLTVRRFLALLTILSMLHLTTVGGDLACAAHGASGARAMAGMAMGGASMHANAAASMSSSPAGEHGSAGAPRDCATPTSTRCCEAMSSCAITVVVSAGERPSLPAPGDVTTPRLAIGVLASVPQSPEPPPPKA